MSKALIKKILPASIVKWALTTRDKIDMHLVKLCVKTRFSSSLYFWLFSGRFHREHQSVLIGRLAYEKSLVNFENSSILLRRNIHRLEKGLIMEPRKPIFAEDYIQETVNMYHRCANSASFCQKELLWAYHVINEYFSIVTHSQIIEQSFKVFQKTPSLESSVESKPYQSHKREKADISQEQLHKLFKQRRSTRWFENIAVEQELLEQAVTMAAQAPSACNRQPFEFYCINSSDKATEIASCAMGTSGFAHNIQSLMVIVGDLSSYPKEQDRHVIYIDGGLAAMQFMLALETLGLASCPINWPDIEPYERKLAKKLSLPMNLRPIMMIAVGYPKDSGGIPFSQKKSSAQLIKVID